MPDADADGEPGAETAGGSRTVLDPSSEAARSLVSTGLEAGNLVTLFGRCTVEYEGRAASTLDAGDRHVMLKPDGTALVHTDDGQQPVNWQPPGCDHSVAVVDDELELVSSRDAPTESVRIRFERIEQVSRLAVRDDTDLDLVGTEDHLRDRILEDPDLVEPGFLPRSTERRTAAGAIDVFGEDADGRSVVLELKRRRAGLDAVSQLKRYVEAMTDDLHADADVRGILLAPSATEPARELLERHDFELVELAPEDA